MYREWLQTDLFSMDNWFLVNNKKSSISDGTVAGQVGNTKQLFPALPMQFLVIKDVEISASDWGSDGGVLQQYYGGAQGSTQSSSSSEQGEGGVCLGFVNFGGSASHAQSQASGQTSSWGQANGSSYFGTTFQNNTLSIPGAQIIAFVCDVVPQSPPLDDPGLNAPAASTSGTSTTPAAAGSTSTTSSGTPTPAASGSAAPAASGTTTATTTTSGTTPSNN
jgi:hypothetical protein